MEYRYRFAIEPRNGGEPEAEILVGELEFETGVETAERMCLLLSKRWREDGAFVAYDIDSGKIVETMSQFDKSRQ